MLDSLTQFVTDVVNTLGYVGVALLVAVENLFPPIPSEVILPLAGFVAGNGDASLIGMILAATIGSVVGSWILYGVSAAVGPDRFHRFVVRYGKWIRLTERDLERAERWFDRRANAAVFIGRCIPLIRSIISVPAGFRRMPFLRFTLLSALGSAIWNTALIGAGAILGDRWRQVGDAVGLFQGVVIVAIAGLLAFGVWRKFLRPRLVRAGDLPAEDSTTGS